jgi:hypothetical protein
MDPQRLRMASNPLDHLHGGPVIRCLAQIHGGCIHTVSPLKAATADVSKLRLPLWLPPTTAKALTCSCAAIRVDRAATAASCRDIVRPGGCQAAARCHQLSRSLIGYCRLKLGGDVGGDRPLRS